LRKLVAITFLTLLLSLAASMPAAFAAPLSWTQVNADGFGDVNNRATYAMATFGGELYTGTNNNSTGTEIWRYDGALWTQVNTDGFGNATNTHTYCMAVYDGRLYAGTYNGTNLAEVWAYDGTSWSPSATGGFGDANYGVFSLVEYGGHLYASTYNTSGCEVWEYDGTTWAQANTNGFGDANNQYGYCLATYNGSLYAGTMNYSTGCEIWGYDGSTWTQANPDGFGDANNLCHSLAAYDGKLYAGTYNGVNGSEVWAYDGTTWAQANADGFGSANNVTSRSMIVYQGRLFLGTQNGAAGGGVWAYDGTAWEQTNAGGFGDVNNVRCYATAVYGGRLYVGTYNPTSGMEAWRNLAFAITATSGAGGSISPSGEVMVNQGADQSFAITPTAGFHVVDVVVDGSSQGPVTSYTFTGVTTTHTISASFAGSSAPNLVLDKTADPSGDVVRGQVMTYTLRARNTGSGLADALPAYTDYVSHSTTLNGILIPDTGGTTPLAAGLQVNSPGSPAGTVAAGSEAVVTLRVQVGADLPLGASIRNVGIFSAAGLQPVEGSVINNSAADLPSTWYFAEGSTQPGFDEYILLSNMSETPMTVTITYLTDGGVERDFSHEVPAHSRRTVLVNAEMPNETGVAAIVKGSPGLICERSVYFNFNGIDGGHQAIGSNAPDVDLFFAEGFTGTEGSPFDEWILVLNPNTAPAGLQVTYMFPDGSTVEKDYEVAGRRRLSINVDSEVGEGREVSARITAGLPVVAERAMYFFYQDQWSGGHIGKAATGTRADWYLAEGFTGWEGSLFDEYILVANDNPSDNPVTVTFMFPDGSTRAFDFTAPATGRLTVNADAWVGEGQMISAHVHAELPVVVERAMYFDYRLEWQGGHNSLGATSPMSSLYFAEGYTGNPDSRFETWLLIQNVSGDEKIAAVDYVLGSGEVITREVTLPPDSRTTVYANEVLRTEALEFSMHVRSKDGSACLLAERAMYFDYLGSFGRAVGGDDVAGY
jgi:hypothetical protein